MTHHPISLSASSRLRLVGAAVLCVAGAACGAGAPDADTAGAASGNSVSTGGTPAPARPPIGPSDSLRPVVASSNGLGRWDIPHLEKRLDLQGMAPQRLPAPVVHPFMSVQGTAYRLGNGELQVFIYEDADALQRDVSRLDTIAVAPPGQKVGWPSRATLIRNNNLAAIFLGENALQIERVQRALMAGLTPGS